MTPAEARITAADQRHRDIPAKEQATPQAKAEARVARAKAVERRRNDEALCALDFLTWGDTQGIHAKRCVRPAGIVCSRDYNPGPKPDNEAMYEDSALGVLWGLNDHEAWQLAGWNITRREETP